METLNAGIATGVKDRCLQFMDEFKAFIETDALQLSLPPIDLADISSIRGDLRRDGFSSLPAFSRKLRSVMRGLSDSDLGVGLNFNIYEEFVARWTELVPVLSLISSSSPVNTESGANGNYEFS